MPASRSTAVAVGEPSSERQRLFLAWLPDPATQARLVALQELLRPRLPRRDYRWVPAHQLHLTLRYFGAVDAAPVAALRQRLPLLAASVAAVAAHVGGWQFWPSPQSPRVLVLRLESRGALERLAAAIEELVGGIGFAREPRRYRAHVTLARAAAGAAPMLPLVEPPPAIPLAIDALALVGSTLRPEGALHEVLERWPLGAGA
jgi:RNA 2',3'-cyclic 3'-phosphodiesterase